MADTTRQAIIELIVDEKGAVRGIRAVGEAGAALSAQIAQVRKDLEASLGVPPSLNHLRNAIATGLPEALAAFEAAVAKGTVTQQAAATATRQHGDALDELNDRLRREVTVLREAERAHLSLAEAKSRAFLAGRFPDATADQRRTFTVLTEGRRRTEDALKTNEQLSALTVEGFRKREQQEDIAARLTRRRVTDESQAYRDLNALTATEEEKRAQIKDAFARRDKERIVEGQAARDREFRRREEMERRQAALDARAIAHQEGISAQLTSLARRAEAEQIAARGGFTPVTARPFVAAQLFEGDPAQRAELVRQQQQLAIGQTGQQINALKQRADVMRALAGKGKSLADVERELAARQIETLTGSKALADSFRHNSAEVAHLGTQFTKTNATGAFFGRTLTNLVERTLRLGVVIAGFGALRFFFRQTRDLFLFNRELEDARLGIASTISAAGQFTDALGAPLPIATQLKLALNEADESIVQLRKDSVALGIPIQSLLEAFTVAAGAAKGAGFEGQKAIRVTEGLLILSQKFGVPISALSKQIDNLFTGGRAAQTTLGRILQLSDALVQRLVQQNKFQDFFLGKLEGVIELQRTEGLDTWTGINAAIASAGRLIAENLGSGAFDEMKGAGREFLGFLNELRSRPDDLQRINKELRDTVGLLLDIGGAAGKAALGFADFVTNKLSPAGVLLDPSGFANELLKERAKQQQQPEAFRRRAQIGEDIDALRKRLAVEPAIKDTPGFRAELAQIEARIRSLETGVFQDSRGLSELERRGRGPAPAPTPRPGIGSLGARGLAPAPPIVGEPFPGLAAAARADLKGLQSDVDKLESRFIAADLQTDERIAKLEKEEPKGAIQDAQLRLRTLQKQAVGAVGGDTIFKEIAAQIGAVRDAELAAARAAIKEERPRQGVARE